VCEFKFSSIEEEVQQGKASSNRITLYESQACWWGPAKSTRVKEVKNITNTKLLFLEIQKMSYPAHLLFFNLTGPTLFYNS
jgi:hypothetical protein